MRTKKQKLANYTELVHPGDGIEIEKGVISSGAKIVWVQLKLVSGSDDDIYITNYTKNELIDLYNSGYTLIGVEHDIGNVNIRVMSQERVNFILIYGTTASISIAVYNWDDDANGFAYGNTFVVS